jgi:hypothetical protein
LRQKLWRRRSRNKNDDGISQLALNMPWRLHEPVQWVVAKSSLGRKLAANMALRDLIMMGFVNGPTHLRRIFAACAIEPLLIFHPARSPRDGWSEAYPSNFRKFS